MLSDLEIARSVKPLSIFEVAEKAGLLDEKRKHEFKPMQICIGEKMVIRGLDDALIEKEIGKSYDIEIQPKDAFGKRNPKLIKTVPLSAFQQMPQPGMFVNVNGLIAKVITITGGRALIDLNNPLAGKIIVYNFKINKIIEDIPEKIKILGRNFGLDIDEVNVEDKKAKIKVKNKKDANLNAFKDKIKTLLNIEPEFI